MMRFITAFLCILVILCGCSTNQDAPPPGYYKLEVETFIHKDDLFICKMRMAFRGKENGWYL